MRKKYQISFISILLLSLGVLFVDSVGYPARSRVLPMVVIIMAGILLAMELFREFLFVSKAGSGDNATQPTTQLPESKRKDLTPLLIPAWIAGFAIMIWLLGLVIALPLFVLAYIKMQGEKWVWAISLSLAMLGVVYIGFGILLGLHLYEGLLFQ